MKKNISSNAIKAMAIGLSVAMGASTAISGVAGNLVAVKAETSDELVKAQTIEIGSNNTTHYLKNTNLDLTNVGTALKEKYILVDQMMFKTSADGTKANLVGFDISGAVAIGTNSNKVDADGTISKPYIGTNIANGVIKITGETGSAGEKSVTIEKIGDGTVLKKYTAMTNSFNAGEKIVATDVINATNLVSKLGTLASFKIGANAFKVTNIKAGENLTIRGLEFKTLIGLTEIGANAFENVTIDGVVDLSKATNLTKIGASAFKGAKINTINTVNTESTALAIGTASQVQVLNIGETGLDNGAFQNAEINGNVNILGAKSQVTTLKEDTFKGTKFQNSNVTLGDGVNTENAKSIFKGAIVYTDGKNQKGNLDVSAATISAETLAGTAETGSDKGVEVQGTLKIKTLNDKGLNYASAGKIDLNGFSTDEVPANAFNGFTLISNEMEFPTTTNKFAADAFNGFKGTKSEAGKIPFTLRTASTGISLKNKSIDKLILGKKVGDINIYLTGDITTKTTTEFPVEAFGSTDHNVTVYLKDKTMKDVFEQLNTSKKFTNKKVKFISDASPKVTKTEYVDGTNPTIKLTVDKELADLPQSPTNTDFTITKNVNSGNEPTVTDVALDGTKKILTLTLSARPIEGEYTVSYKGTEIKEKTNNEVLEILGQNKFTVSKEVTASTTNSSIIGYVGEPLTETNITVTLANGTFKVITATDDVTSWITNLPAGLTVTAEAVEGKNTATITISGTPEAEKTAGNIEIKIPSDKINATDSAFVANPVVVTGDVKLEVKKITSSVTDLDVTGSVNNDIGQDKTITITTDAAFNKIDADTNVTSWITNLPEGLSAKVKTAVKDNDQKVDVTISGKPTRASRKNEAMVIVIPKDKIKAGIDVKVDNNINAKFNITDENGGNLVLEAPKEPTSITTDGINTTVVVTYGEKLYKSETPKVEITGDVLAKYEITDGTKTITATATAATVDEKTQVTFKFKNTDLVDGETVVIAPAAQTLQNSVGAPLTGNTEFKVDVVGPTLKDKMPTVDAANKTFTIDMNEEVQLSATTDFTITHKKTINDSETEIKLNKTELSNDATKIIITTTNDIEDGIYTVNYKADGENLKDSIGNKAEKSSTKPVSVSSYPVIGDRVFKTEKIDQTGKLAIVGVANKDANTTYTGDHSKVTTLGNGTKVDGLMQTDIDLLGGKVIEKVAANDIMTLLATSETPKVFNNLTVIKENALEGNKDVKNLNLPTIKEVSAGALKGSEVATVDLPAMEKITENMFQGASKVTNISLPNVKEVPANAFQGADAVKNIDLSGAETVAAGAFSNTSVETVTIENPKSVDKNAFQGANGNVVINTTETGKEAFGEVGGVVVNEIPTIIEAKGSGKTIIITASESLKGGNNKGIIISSVTKDGTSPTVDTYTIDNNKITITTKEELLEGKYTVEIKKEANITDENSANLEGIKEFEVTSDGIIDDISPSPSPSGGSNGGGYGSNSYKPSSDNTSTEESIEESTDSETTESGEIIETPSQDLSLDAITLPAIAGESKVFSDVAPTHWATQYIDKLSKAGIINGMQDGSFSPSGNAKRADVAIMISKLLGVESTSLNSFNDVDPNAYYAEAVASLKEFGIVNGSNGNFNPQNKISRQDTMIMIGQVLKGLNLDVNTDTSALDQFSDKANIGAWATEYVSILVNSGIVSGSNGKINPKADITRAEIATIISKVYDLIETEISSQPVVEEVVADEENTATETTEA